MRPVFAVLPMFARLAVGLVLLAAAAAARADQVELVNGDRLSGRILHLGAGVLTLRTDYAGELKIRWSEVRTLSSDAPLRVVTEPGSAGVARRLARAEGRHVDLVGEAGALPLDRIAYLNPVPEETGQGVSRRGRASVSASDTRGNATADRIYAEAELTSRARGWRHTLGGKVNRASDAGRTTSSAWLGQGNYDRFVSDDRFLYLRGSLEHDRFKDVDLRAALGGGYGWQLLDTERTSLSLRAGLDWVMVNPFAAADESYPAAGWGVKASHRLGEGIELFHDQDGFFNIEDGESLTLRTRTGLRVPLMHGLNASLQVNADWERRPAPGRRATDSTVLLGVGYEW